MPYEMTNFTPDEYCGGVEFETRLLGDVSSFFSFHSGGQVSPMPVSVRSQLPDQILWHNKFDKQPDVIARLETLILSQRFKLMIDELDPGMHEFHPVDLIDVEHGSKRYPYFIINAVRLEETVDEACSVVIERIGINGKTLKPDPTLPKIRTVAGARSTFLRPDKIVAHNFWRSEGFPMVGYWVVSDALKERIEAEGLVGPKFEKFKTT